MKKLLLIFFIFILNSCQTPLGGAKDVENIDPEERPGIESIEAGLWMQMNNYEEQLKTSGSRVKDKNLDKYLKDLLCALTVYCKDIRVYVLDIPYFNAFMAPNGMMVVWTGLLLRVGNEAQLAAVIGHEAGHYIRRHSLKAWLDAKARTDLMAILSIGLAVGGVPGGGDIFNISQLLQAGIMAKHSRDNEREADEIGLDSLIKAGYDPDEAPKIWENILKEMELGENKNPPAFFSSHPNPKERIKNLFNFKTLNKRISYKSNGKLIIVFDYLNTVPLNLYFTPDVISQDILSITSVINRLDKSIRKDTILRLNRSFYKEVFGIKYFNLLKDIGITIDDGKKSMSKLIKEARLCLFTYDSTGFLENYIYNIPSIIFSNKNYLNVINNEFYPKYKELQKNEILFDEEENLTKHINSKWN